MYYPRVLDIMFSKDRKGSVQLHKFEDFYSWKVIREGKTWFHGEYTTRQDALKDIPLGDLDAVAPVWVKGQV